jgi:aryl-alcohol dehydrogenase-like predicted oxidoreductase
MDQPAFNAEERILLGKTDIQVSTLGLGAWSWGDRMIWNYGHGYSDADIRAAFDASLQAGVNFIDTAEVYGSGRSERLLGSFLPSTQGPNGMPSVVVATKFMPYPWRLGRSALLRALRNSLERLDLERVDLYQIHWPFPMVPVETWASALADVVGGGLARAVGVSNYNEAQMRRAYSVLVKRGVPLASNQVSYSLVNRKVELNGLLKTCREMGITLIAYSPLEKGTLTGKYTPDKPLSGVRGQRYPRAFLERLQPLIQLMRGIGEAHNGKTPSQVSLNWLICKGALPIPGAKNVRQARENAGALGWRLSEADVAALDEASALLQ